MGRAVRPPSYRSAWKYYTLKTWPQPSWSPMMKRKSTSPQHPWIMKCGSKSQYQKETYEYTWPQGSQRVVTSLSKQPFIHRHTSPCRQPPTHRNTSLSRQPPTHRNTSPSRQPPTHRNTSLSRKPPIHRNTSLSRKPPTHRNTSPRK